MVSPAYQKRAPLPLFDTLEQMQNPWQHPPELPRHPKTTWPDYAIQDFRRSAEFLYSYRGSADTFSSYRRELEHFLQ